MLSALAQQFSTHRTAANFNRLADAEPLTAAKFLSRAADAGAIDAPWKTQLQQILSTGLDPAPALKTFFAANQPVIAAMEMAAVQAARVDTLGFTTRTPEPVQLTGVVGIASDGDAPTLTTSEGTFRLEMPRWPDSSAGGSQTKYFEVNTLQAFDGRIGTIRAYPTDTPGTLAVEEFSPSSNPSFVSGRLATMPNGNVGINVRPDKWVELRDPAVAAGMAPLAKAMSRGFAGTGVIVPGAVAKQDAQGWYLDGPVKDYWMLAASHGEGMMLAGHGLRFPVEGVTPWPEDPTTRLLVYGHANANRTVAVSGYLKTPQVRVEDGVKPKRDGPAMMKLAPVEIEPPPGGVDRFTP